MGRAMRAKLCDSAVNTTMQPPPGFVGPDDEPRAGDAIAHLLRIVGILRRRWLVVAVTTIVCLAAAATAIKMLTPRWRASASIVLHMSGPQVFDKISGVSEDVESRTLAYKEYYQTQRTILQSRAVAERALATLGLASDPEFLGVAHLESEEERAEALEHIDPIERLRRIVSVQEVRNSRVVEISAEYPDPEVARDIANAVAAAYIEHVRTSRSRVGTEAKDNIALERTEAMTRLREAEQKLEAFKKDNSITSISLSDRQNVITQDILTLSTRAKEAEADRIKLERMVAEARTLYQGGNLAATSLLPEDKREVLEQMRKDLLAAQTEFRSVDVEYGPKHEEHRKAAAKLEHIERSIERESRALLDSLESRLAAARAVEKDLARSLGRENARALRLGGLERQYREFEREAQVAAEDYLLVARRDTEITLTNRVDEEGIEILDAATAPTDPVFPRKPLFFGLAMVAGLGLGSLLALSMDFRDQRLRGLLDLERAISRSGVPVLGQLPLIPPDSRLGIGNARAQRRQRDLYAHLFPQSLMAERCRGIRTSIAFVQGSEPARTIMITSPGSSEGKSATAMNLALSFAQSGKRVAIVDADMRRPRLHLVFGKPLGNGDRGLATVLRGRDTLSTALTDPPEEGLDAIKLLPCGEIPDNPAELLESIALHQCLAELREQFNVVIIDSPPVMPVADPLILAPQVDGVIVVSRCNRTTRGELQRALEQLRRSEANLLGVVLNEVDARQDRYDYGGGYYTYRARDTGTDARS
jgi:polysaccharide biosynthesis transport protein